MNQFMSVSRKPSTKLKGSTETPIQTALSLIADQPLDSHNLRDFSYFPFCSETNAHEVLKIIDKALRGPTKLSETEALQLNIMQLSVKASLGVKPVNTEIKVLFEQIRKLKELPEKKQLLLDWIELQPIPGLRFSDNTIKSTNLELALSLYPGWLESLRKGVPRYESWWAEQRLGALLSALLNSGLPEDEFLGIQLLQKWAHAAQHRPVYSLEIQRCLFQLPWVRAFREHAGPDLKKWLWDQRENYGDALVRGSAGAACFHWSEFCSQLIQAGLPGEELIEPCNNSPFPGVAIEEEETWPLQRLIQIQQYPAARQLFRKTIFKRIENLPVFAAIADSLGEPELGLKWLSRFWKGKEATRADCVSRALLHEWLGQWSEAAPFWSLAMQRKDESNGEIPNIEMSNLALDELRVALAYNHLQQGKLSPKDCPKISKLTFDYYELQYLVHARIQLEAMWPSARTHHPIWKTARNISTLRPWDIPSLLHLMALAAEARKLDHPAWAAAAEGHVQKCLFKLLPLPVAQRNLHVVRGITSEMSCPNLVSPYVHTSDGPFVNPYLVQAWVQYCRKFDTAHIEVAQAFELLDQMDDPESTEAISPIKTLLSGEPQDGHRRKYLILLAKALIHQSKWAEAKPILEKLLELGSGLTGKEREEWDAPLTLWSNHLLREHRWSEWAELKFRLTGKRSSIALFQEIDQVVKSLDTNLER